jgi:SynChlorMet cassette protein ScmC
LKGGISCSFRQNGDENLETIQLMQLCSIFALDAITRGGMLLHGALIERAEKGVILAGPGGVGKSTACDRLPDAWQVLSDDSTLIVRDDFGEYWAHPWPTWSRFLEEKVGGSWEVSRGIRLKSICFLSQSPEQDLYRLGEGETVCLGMESIEQASRMISQKLDQISTRKLSNLHFRNISQMAKRVPAYQLELNEDGPFWELMHFTKDRVLG